jgi:hypothetical protein
VLRKEVGHTTKDSALPMILAHSKLGLTPARPRRPGEVLQELVLQMALEQEREVDLAREVGAGVLELELG